MPPYGHGLPPWSRHAPCLEKGKKPGMPGERWKSREQKAGSAALLPDFARLKSRAKIRENPGEAGKSREKPGRRAADQNPGLPANSVAYGCYPDTNTGTCACG